MGFCCYRRLTKTLLGLLSAVLICSLLSASLHSWIPVALNLKLTAKTVDVDFDGPPANRPGPSAPLTRDVLSADVKLGPDLNYQRNADVRPLTLPSVIHDGHLGATIPTVPKGHQKKILIVAYYRSGSTLTGSFFDHQPGTFYSFEPLHSLFRLTDKKQPMLYFNGRKRPTPARNELNVLSLEILRGLYSCDFNNLDWSTMTSGFGSKSSAYRRYVGCVKSFDYRANDFIRKVKDFCIPGLIQKCKSSHTIVVKSIRMRMELAEELLKAIPDLKIVHLFRDPRGMACSLRGKTCLSSLSGSNALCERLANDVVRRRSLAQRLPGNVYAVQYEALVETPLLTLTHMFNYLGIVLHSDVAKWIFETFYSGSQDDRPLSVTKSDSVATAYNWTRRIDWRVVNRYQETCSEFLDAEGYPYFSDLQDVRHFQMPVRNTTEQSAELKRFILREHG